MQGFIILARLKISVYLVAILLTVSIAAKAVGSLQPINPALRGFIEGCEDKPQPCWYGIVPGVTTIEEAQTLLEAGGLSTKIEHRDQLYPNVLIVNNAFEKFRCEISYITGQRSLPDYMMFSKCSDLAFADLYFMVEYPGMAATDPCIPTVTLYYPFGSIVVVADIEELPLLHKPALIKSFELHPVNTRASENLRTLIVDTKTNAVAPHQSWWYLQLVYIDVTGCG